eukprot:jgi/Hompol1/5175/HPOL_001227-RA
MDPENATANDAATTNAASNPATITATLTRWLKTFVQFMGPGYLVSIGYFDPGNWATDLAAGSQFGYRLLFVILLSNIIAVVLQTLSVRLGVVTGMDLATCCRKTFPTWVSWVLYVFCELAIVACDLAEVIGSAIALKLLFGLPLYAGVAITALDVLIILFGWNAKHLRYFEAGIMVLVGAVITCFVVLIAKSSPQWDQVGLGFLPSTEIVTNSTMLFIAIGIVGATVMPHNLYLHSSLVRYRSSSEAKADGDVTEIDKIETDSTSSSCRPFIQKGRMPLNLSMATIDTAIALTVALFINAAILIVSSANFNAIGRTDIAQIEDAYDLMNQLLGKFAATLFAIALLLSGQSSTFTGTLAGQFVMEGFIGNKISLPPWARRLVTRLLAIIPALTVVITVGEKGLSQLLIISQVVLSLQLPFAMWPLIYFTSSRAMMTVKFCPQTDTGSVSSLETSDDPRSPSQPAQPIRLRPDSTRSVVVIENQQQHEHEQQQQIAQARASNVDEIVEVEDDFIEQCFANTIPTIVFVSILGLLITALNVMVLVQLAMGTGGSGS